MSCAMEPLSEHRYMPNAQQAMSERIRKSVCELTLADLRDFPVWEFCLDEEGVNGQDEETVRPLPIHGPLDASLGMFLVRAAFRCADGSTMSGYLTPAVHRDYSIGIVQPIIITDVGQVGIWFGCAVPDAATVARSYAAMGKNGPAAVFPLHYESQVELLGGPLEGVLTGFMFFADWHGNEIREVV
jgi:hypothetical protein